MIRHLFTLIWNRKRTNVLMMTEIFVSFLVLFAVVALGDDVAVPDLVEHVAWFVHGDSPSGK